MRRILVGLTLTCALLGGCNEGPAREVLDESERAIEAARPQLAQHAPAELRALEASAAAIRAQIEAGQHTAALEQAQRLPGRVADAVAQAESRKRELVTEWSTLSGRVPLILDGAAARAAELAAGARGPRGLTPEALAAAQAEIGVIRQSWAEARATFERGEVAQAVAAGTSTQARAESLAAQLGLAPAAAMAAAAGPVIVAPPTPTARPGATRVPARPAETPAGSLQPPGGANAPSQGTRAGRPTPTPTPPPNPPAATEPAPPPAT
jgi:hypothetical protein